MVTVPRRPAPAQFRCSPTCCARPRTGLDWTPTGGSRPAGTRTATAVASTVVSTASSPADPETVAVAVPALATADPSGHSDDPVTGVSPGPDERVIRPASTATRPARRAPWAATLVARVNHVLSPSTWLRADQGPGAVVPRPPAVRGRRCPARRRRIRRRPQTGAARLRTPLRRQPPLRFSRSTSWDGSPGAREPAKPARRSRAARPPGPPPRAGRTPPQIPVPSTGRVNTGRSGNRTGLPPDHHCDRARSLDAARMPTPGRSATPTWPTGPASPLRRSGPTTPPVEVAPDAGLRPARLRREPRPPGRRAPAPPRSAPTPAPRPAAAR